MSVRVFEINGQEIIARLKVWAEKLSGDKNVLAVVLFGSLVTNEETPASDADILILLKESKERFDDRIPHFIPEKIGIGVDVFPYTLAEFYSSLDENWGMAREVLKQGVLLYGAGNTEKNRFFRDWFSTLDE